ncbi:glycosyltransferase family 4 protein [Vibrio alginolyticus]|uniref:glycosyltransferase family 4 protein n=1 Tax=Vibrio alginolyticus TaxID=663 RepID=UPI00215D2CBA|nr:glycosyltransferase family 4 protein [Vibrio alginolyticus]MCR9389656.1 glycosyltransferase family 4 protein [Vibrio alginolyticus]
MKIIFATRSDYLTKKGGDTTQLLMTKKYLEDNHDTDVTIVTDTEELAYFSEDAIVHVFNLQTQKLTLEYIKTAKSQNKKVALSTIYWDLLDSYIVELIFSKTRSVRFSKTVRFVISMLTPILNRLPGERYLRREYICSRRSILDSSDILLPNSIEELKVIEKEFGYHNLSKKAHVVPNAVVVEGKPCLDNDKKGVLIVGRIEPSKNQLNLIRAIKSSKLSDVPIYIIGRIGNEDYFELLKRESLSLTNVVFIEELPYEEVVEYYKRSKVHVLPSFRESPGLVSLEALYYGCNIVVSEAKHCPVEFYEFSKYGFLCDPYSVDSIKCAIENAYENNVIVPSEYFEKFSFGNVAIETYKAYEKIRKN